MFFINLEKDRVMENKVIAGESDEIHRTLTGIVIPGCQSQFLAGNELESMSNKNDCSGIFGNVCVHNISDMILGSVFSFLFISFPLSLINF